MTVISHTPLSRLLAVALLLAVLGLCYLFLVVPLLHYHGQNEAQITQLTRQLQGFRRIAASRGEIEKMFKSIRPDENAAGYYLKGATQALASAELQTYARTIIEKSDGSLVSTQPIVKAERDPERMVRVSVRMRGRLETLLQVFYSIATGVPVVLTDDILIRTENSSLSRGSDGHDEDILDVQFTLTGFVKESVL